MTPEQFVYWLQGFVEISGKKELTPEQMVIVQDHLKLVFDKVTPDRRHPLDNRKCEKDSPHDRDNVNISPSWPVKLCSKSPGAVDVQSLQDAVSMMQHGAIYQKPEKKSLKQRLKDIKPILRIPRRNEYPSNNIPDNRTYC